VAVVEEAPPNTEELWEDAPKTEDIGAEEEPEVEEKLVMTPGSVRPAAVYDEAPLPPMENPTPPSAALAPKGLLPELFGLPWLPDSVSSPVSAGSLLVRGWALLLLRIPPPPPPPPKGFPRPEVAEDGEVDDPARS
jgi:hypothetical protein